MNLKIAVIALAVSFASGAAISYGVTHWRDDAKIVALQTASADSAKASAARDSAGTRFADSLKHVIAIGQAAGNRRDVVVVRMDTLADSLDHALAALTTAADSIHNYQLQIVDLKAERDTLKAGRVVDKRLLFLAVWRGDSLQKLVVADSGTIQNLNRQVQQLNHKTLPKWLDLSFTWGQRLLAVKGGYDALKGR